MISDKTISSAFSAADIVEVIGRFVQLKKSGQNYKGLSPFSNEQTPSFMVSPAKQIWKDFSSGKGGNVASFLMEHENLTYPQAIKYLCDMYQIEFEEIISEEERQERINKESLYIITETSVEYFQSNLVIDGVTQIIQDRQISNEMINKFKIGFGPNVYSGLTNYLLGKGFNWHLAVQTSLLGYKNNKIYDRFRNRLMFPIRNLTGRVVGFGGRDVAWYKGSPSPKYLNSSDSIVYNKSEVLYGIFEGKKAIIDRGFAFICEGYTDVIGFHQIGIENIVAASGTSFTVEQARAIRKLTSNTTVLFDSDSSGIKAAIRSIDILLSQGISVKVCLLPPGEDPDSFRKTRTYDQVMKYITDNQQDFIVFKLEYLMKESDDFSSRGNAINEVVATIAKISNPIMRELYLKECSSKTNIDITALRMMISGVSEDNETFSEVPEGFKEIVENNTREFLIDQCEKKIVQYLLAYSNFELEFRNIYLEADYDEVVQQNVIEKCTVKQKIEKDLSDNYYVFKNPDYSVIYEKAVPSDLSDLNSWVEIFGPELNLKCRELCGQQLNDELSSFRDKEIKAYEYVMKDYYVSLANSISETLMFLGFLHIENLINEEGKKPEPDMDMIFEMMNLSTQIKVKLNII